MTDAIFSIVVPPLPTPAAFKKLSRGGSELVICYNWFSGVNSVVDSIGELANTANGGAVAANVQASMAANTVAVYANSTLIHAASNLNFVNTATMNVLCAVSSTVGQVNVYYTANLTAIAGGAYAQANAAETLAAQALLVAENAYGEANLGVAIATSAYGAANAISAASNAVLGVANSAANTVAVYAYGTLVLANANLNFINSTSVNATALANGTTQTNIAFTVNTSANLISLNVSANISNTGNLLVTQNTYTGNLSVTTLANVATLNVSTQANVALINVYGIISGNANPLANNQTRAITGLIGLMTLPNTVVSSTALTPNANLVLTFNETGWYAIDLFLKVAANVGVNGAGGFQFDLGSNSAITANIGYYVTQDTANGVVTGNVITVNTTTTNANSISTTNATPSFFRGQGTLTITTAGTLGVRYAQNTSTANGFTVLQGSYFKAERIG